MIVIHLSTAFLPARTFALRRIRARSFVMSESSRVHAFPSALGLSLLLAQSALYRKLTRGRFCRSACLHHCLGRGQLDREWYSWWRCKWIPFIHLARSSYRIPTAYAICSGAPARPATVARSLSDLRIAAVSASPRRNSVHGTLAPPEKLLDPYSHDQSVSLRSGVDTLYWRRRSCLPSFLSLTTRVTPPTLG